MNGLHMPTADGKCKFCGMNIGPALAGTACPANILDVPDAKERRRYALLQAAAQIYRADSLTDVPTIVETAEQFLEEIEFRENGMVDDIGSTRVDS